MANPTRITHAVMTLDGTAQALSAGIPAGGSIRSLSLQPGAANTNAVFVGGPGVSATVYGVRLPVPVTSIPPAPFLLEDLEGKMSLEEVYVIGTNGEKLHLLLVCSI